MRPVARNNWTAGAVLAGALAVSAGTAQADRIPNPTVVFSGLDKITGRIVSFEAAVDETVQFGGLQMTPRVCYTRPPTESPNTTSFVEVDEVTLDNKYRRIFSGWMFASSPGLHGVEHPVYDIWLVDCKGGTRIIAEPKETTPDPTPAAAPARRPGQGAAPAPAAPAAPPPPAPGTRIDVAPPRGVPVQPRQQPSQQFFPQVAPAER
jgi:hypothetical protein